MTSVLKFKIPHLNRLSTRIVKLGPSSAGCNSAHLIEAKWSPDEEVTGPDRVKEFRQSGGVGMIGFRLMQRPRGRRRDSKERETCRKGKCFRV